MYVTNGIEPSAVLRHFEDISRIPRGSGDERAVSNYIKAYAERLGLEVRQDELYNLLVYKPAGPSHQDSETIILQGHLDMVNEKVRESAHDFTKDGLELYLEGDWLSAKGTTLGADNGIAVAMMMAIMELDLDLPPLELVMTVDEETGMSGAAAFNAEWLKGRTLINIDNEEEGVFLSSCAGGVRVRYSLPLEFCDVPEDGVWQMLSVRGLKGGHSGMEITKERGNAPVLLARVLENLIGTFDLYVGDINGGAKDNAIPREASARIYINKDEVIALQVALETLESTLKREFRSADPGLQLILEPCGDAGEVMSLQSAAKAVNSLLLFPNGIAHMSMDIAGLVEVSNNIGVVRTEDGHINITTAVRSSVMSRKQEIVTRIKTLAAVMGANVTTRGDYPAWEFNSDSKIRRIFCEAYKAQSGKEAEVTAIHAGVECGLFAEKVPGIDMIAFGPEMLDVHTPDERLNLPSVARTWALLLDVLAKY